MKLLVATEFPPDAPGGGPAVVRQMLKGFPGEIHWWSVKRGNGEKMKTKKMKEVRVAKHFCGCPPGKLMPARKLRKLKAWLMENFWASRAARDLERIISEVKPDCVWVIPHDFSIFPIWRVMGSRGARVERRGLRWHVTVQDYPDVHGYGRAWGENRVQRMARMQEKIYASADSRDATSFPMLEDLEKRTGKAGMQMLHQGLEPEDFTHLEVPPPLILSPQSSVIKIAYAGTILCEPEFTLFVSLLQKLRQQSFFISHQSSVISHFSFELHFYGTHSYASRIWFNPEWMFEHGNFPERELLAELRKCDWGFIPMSLEDTDPRYNRFSFPTKFITYLAAGLPIITVGHPESSVMKMATAYNVGVTIQNPIPSLDQFGAALFAANTNSAYLHEILRCAREQFDAEKMRRKLWKAFGVAK